MCGGSAGDELAEVGFDARAAELRHRLRLDLADPLPREAEALADLLEGAGLAAVEAEAEPQDLALALVEGPEQALAPAAHRRRHSGIDGGERVGVADAVGQLGVAVLADGHRQA